MKIKSIKENHIFRRAYNKGASAVTPTVVLYTLKGKSTRLGITVNRKLGGAVQRNRAKRLIREAFRRLSAEEPQITEKKVSCIVVARTKCFLPKTKSDEVYSDLRRAFEKLKVISE